MLDNPFLFIVGIIIILILLFFLKKEKSKQKMTDGDIKKTNKTKKEPKKNITDKSEKKSSSSSTQHSTQDADLSWDNHTANTKVSIEKVDNLSEYQVYKQFGYFDQAASSLNNYLRSSENKPKKLIFELCGLLLEADNIDGLITALEENYDYLNRDEVEEIIKMALDADINNLNLRVFADEKLGWDVSAIATLTGENEEITTPIPSSEQEEVITNSFGNIVNQTKKGLDDNTSHKILLKGYMKLDNIDQDEVTALSSLTNKTAASNLLYNRLDYIEALRLIDDAYPNSNRPANIALNALQIDFKNKHIHNYARHLWQLFMSLGKQGRTIKERMLGLGFSLGQHPIFNKLEAMPNIIELKEMGLLYKFSEPISNTFTYKDAHPLIIEDNSLMFNDFDTLIKSDDSPLKFLTEAESQIMYGQVNEAMNTLEKGVFTYPQESQLYTMLFNLYTRSEDWERFKKFSQELRSNVNDIPEEIVILLSNISNKLQKNERGV